jgi:hypothetical protein
MNDLQTVLLTPDSWLLSPKPMKAFITGGAGFIALIYRNIFSHKAARFLS